MKKVPWKMFAVGEEKRWVYGYGYVWDKVWICRICDQIVVPVSMTSDIVGPDHIVCKRLINHATGHNSRKD